MVMIRERARERQKRINSKSTEKLLRGQIPSQLISTVFLHAKLNYPSSSTTYQSLNN